MSNIFCSQCGSKHSVGSRFCSSCGSPLSSFAAPKQQNQHVEVYHDEPSSFSRPKGLSYEIQNGGNNIFKGEEIFKSSPIDEHDKLNRPATQAKQLTQEEYLAESLKECAPRGMQDIDET